MSFLYFLYFFILAIEEKVVWWEKNMWSLLDWTNGTQLCNTASSSSPSSATLFPGKGFEL